MEEHIGLKIHMSEITFNVTDKAYVKAFDGDTVLWGKTKFSYDKFLVFLKLYKEENPEMYKFIFEDNLEYLI